jgi:hypothetical protein
MSSGVIQVDFVGLEKAIDDLGKASSKAVPFAMRESVNRAAFAGRNVWTAEMRGDLILRNTWTERSVRVSKATASGLDAEATLGSTERYVRTQEFGGRKAKKGRYGVGIPTGFASGEGGKSIPRHKLVRRSNALAAIQIARRVRGGPKQRNAASIRLAKKGGGRGYAFLQMGKKAGLFRVSGGKRRTKLELLWDVSHTSVRIPKNPMLQRTLDRLNPTLPSLYMGVLREQLRRHRLFGY